ncbi:MAG TPA: hypothetical protein VK395_00960 [Gemmataceae bacterium]|nr:hypothetical protein [Gemmataceae bacterium]
MARKPFLLRIDSELLDALERWANQELRSLNGQIEYVLRAAVVKHGAKLPQKNQDDEDKED